mgnify:CR=1 FL=1
MYADIEKLLLMSTGQAPSQSRIKVQTQQIPACAYKTDKFESLKYILNIRLHYPWFYAEKDG